MSETIAAKPKVFISANNDAYYLVKWFAQELIKDEIAIPIETGSIDSSGNNLDKIVSICNECDFAVIFLTKNVQKAYPRNNAIFESGFFAGALGLDPKRCILVSSVHEIMLPSAIEGITLITIEEPLPPEPPMAMISNDWCEQNLQGVLENIVTLINKKGELLKRPLLNILSKTQLAEREQIGDDCLESSGKVIICTEIVDCSDFIQTKVAVENLKNNIDYEYHFRALADEQYFYSNLINHIRMLVIAYCTDNQTYSQGDFRNESYIMDVLNQEISPQKIANVKDNFYNHLSIFIHKSFPTVPIRFIIHNANSPSKAKCFLHHSDRYVEWFTGEDAYRIAGFLTPKDWESVKMRVLKNTDTFIIYKVIQQPTTMTEDSGAQIRNIMMKKIIEKFPQRIWEDIVFLCFGKSDSITKEWHLIVDSIGK